MKNVCSNLYRLGMKQAYAELSSGHSVPDSYFLGIMPAQWLIGYKETWARHGWAEEKNVA